MKCRSLGVLLSCVLAFCVGCDEVEDLDNFDVPVVQQVTLPGATPIEQILGDFPQLREFTAFDLSQSSTFKNEGYSVNDVDSVVLESMTMRVVSPEGQDLSFFGEVRFVLEKEGLEPIELAQLDEFPVGVTMVQFNTTGQDLKRYVLGGEANIVVEVKDSGKPDRETVLEVKAVFDVDVNVL